MSSPSESQRLSGVIDNDTATFAARQRALLAGHTSRPEATTRAYAGKQEEFRRWATQTRKFDDGETVTEGKVLLFLEEEVIGRQVRSTRKRKRNDNSHGNDAPEEQQRTIGLASLEAYAAAMVDLWHQQSTRGANLHPTPRTKALGSLLNSVRRSEAQRRRTEFVDRAANTVVDGYNQAAFLQICRKVWTLAATEGTREEHWLRTLADLLLGHHFLARGENRRYAELPDLQYLPLAEGPSTGRCDALLLIMNQGKVNQHGRTEYAGALRNREVVACVLSALAVYLFTRWDGQEPFPDFSANARWYPVRVVKGTTPTSELSASSQRLWASRAYAAAGIRTSKATHAGRSSGSRFAESLGVSEGQIRRAGRWNNDSMTSSYLAPLPREFMRAMAGFPKDDPLAYYIPRQQVAPSDALAAKIWPQLDAATRAYEEASQVDIATGGFLRLLSVLRVVLLQDSAILRAEFPGLSIWKHGAFNCPEYADFAAQVRASLASEQLVPGHLRINQAAPEIVSSLNSGFQTVSTDLGTLGAALGRRIQDVQDDFRAMAGGVWELRRVRPRSRDAPSPPRLLEGPEPAAQAAPPSQPPANRLATPPPAAVPTYTMDKTVSTVAELWREWTEGRNGGPAVQDLDRLYGARWRANNHALGQFYSLRRTIIDEVRARGAGREIGAAIAELEGKRAQAGHKSLDWLAKAIRAERKRDQQG